MANYTVKRYQASDSERWNDFASKAKNATFLFNRGFMDYHADRFHDHSLLVYDESKLLAILPAHQAEKQLYSHWGLTYGGLVHDEKLKLKQVIFALRAILEYLNKTGVEKLQVKTIPSIYHKLPSDEFSYAVFVAHARLTRRDSLSVIDLAQPYSISKTRRESIRRGQNNNLEIREEANFELFWNEILLPNLEAKHQIKPVHSAEEMQLLHSRFPQNIRHFNVYDNGKIVAGTTVFITDTVAHPQYISGNKDKNSLGSLDYLYHFLIADVFRHKRFFDFGISNEARGTKLNEGLVFWKESFGANAITQDFYEIPTQNFTLLDTVLI